jgi:RNA polymerase sigma-B factor
MATINPSKEAAESSATFTTPPGSQIRRSLAGLDDGELLTITQSLPRASERRIAACELLVSRHRAMVRFCVQRYTRSAQPDEDLMQVGYVGLMKAINNFDPAVGRSLAAYAQPTIIGELKRHFRDKSWAVHIKRSAQELVLEVRDATGPLTQELRRAPVESDLLRCLGISSADLRDARIAELAFQPASLDAPLGGGADATSLAQLLGEDDRRFEHMLAMQCVATHWGELPARERKILLMRFNGDMTQTQIGQQLGISQMQVSRLLSHALGYLRPRVLGLEEYASAA